MVKKKDGHDVAKPEVKAEKTKETKSKFPSITDGIKGKDKKVKE